MSIETVNITLDRYHGFQELQKKLNSAENELINLKQAIKEVYTVEILPRGVVADPLSAKTHAIINLNEKKLADLLGLDINQSDIKAAFALIREVYEK